MADAGLIVIVSIRTQQKSPDELAGDIEAWLLRNGY